MQTVWSRIAQTRASCRCPSCAATASGIARRATTATGKRPQRYFTSSTFVYSGIFAAAATTDAVIKEDRRKRWDEAIADLKHGLGAESAQDEPRYKQGLLQEPSHLTKEEPFPMSEPDEIEAIFEKAQPIQRGPIWPASTGIDLNRHNIPPQSIHAKSFARERAARRKWTIKKLHTVELSIEKFVLRTLLYLDDRGLREGAMNSLPELFRQAFHKPRSELEQMLSHTQTQLSEVRSVDPQQDSGLSERRTVFTRYEQDDFGRFHQTSEELNDSLQALFEKPRDHTHAFNSLLAKVAYNLAISSAPPSLACYNSLLTGLHKQGGDTHVMRYAIECMRESHIRMNETSFITILDHYTQTDNSKGFKKFVGLMRGMHNGLDLARPDVKINKASQSRLFLVPGPNGDKVIQKPYPVPSVFEALIRGVLHFNGFMSALQICQSMGQEGWGLSIRGLTPLLTECVWAGNWESGNAVWQQIKLVQKKSEWHKRAEKIHLSTYATMLRLCNVSGQQYAYHSVFDEALRTGYSQSLLMNRLVSDVPISRYHISQYGTLAKAKRQLSGSTKNSQRHESMEYADSSVIDTECRDGQMEELLALAPRTGAALDAPAGRILESGPDQESSTDLLMHKEAEMNLPARHPRALHRQPVSRSKVIHESISRAQLAGDMPSSYELDHYETCERPMSLVA